MIYHVNLDVIIYIKQTVSNNSQNDYENIKILFLRVQNVSAISKMILIKSLYVAQ